MTLPTPAPASATARRFRIPSTVIAWLALVGFLVLAKLSLPLFPPIDIQTIEREFTWSGIGLVAVLGLIGAWLAEPTGFMPALDARVTNHQRFVRPVLYGILIGVAAVLIDLVTQGTKFVAAQLGTPSFNVSFPTSLVVYSAGAVSVELIYRLLPFPLLFGLVGYLILRRRWESRAFVITAVILSLFEGLTQGLGILFMQPTGNIWVPFFTLFLPYLATNYPLNLIQAFQFRRYGLLASFVMRIGYYLVWHVLYGSLIYPAWFS